MGKDRRIGKVKKAEHEIALVRAISAVRSVLCIGMLWWLIPLSVGQAQITLDGTLGPKGSLPGPDYTIDAQVGRQVGSNLFHSFGDFNVHTGESATFTGPDGVQNVIGRVTGGHLSDIDGAIRSEMPDANLYLLNPAGVMFGPNATLDVPGSFHVSTADYLKLGDGGRFAATQPETSVLTSAPPTAFGFLGPNPAPISIQGSSLFLTGVKTLSVIGGDIDIVNGRLANSNAFPYSIGQINTISTASPGEVELEENTRRAGVLNPKNIESFEQLGEIKLENSRIGIQGSGGVAFIRGGRLMMNNSEIGANSGTFGGGNEIDVGIRNDLILSNGSTIQAEGFIYGNPGHIRVDAKHIVLTEGAKISNSGAVIGRGSLLEVTAADSISISGRGKDDSPSGIFSTTVSNLGGFAEEFPLTISTSTLEMDGGLISTENLSGSQVAGSIEVNVGRLALSNGAQIRASTSGTGNGGDVIIRAADSITISGHDGESSPSGLFSSSRGEGSGGTIQVQARQISLSDRGTVSATSSGSGSAGDIQIQADKTFRSNKGSVTTASTQAGGGRIALSAGETIELVKSDVTTSVQGGSGDAGNITIDPQAVVLNSSKVIAQAKEGDGGNINIEAEVLLASPDSVVSASSETGVSGTVDIRGVVNNLSGSLAPLTQEYQNTAVLAADRCAGRIREGAVGSFVMTGRSGLPVQPGGLLPSAALVTRQPEGAGRAEPLLDSRVAKWHLSTTHFVLNDECAGPAER